MYSTNPDTILMFFEEGVTRYFHTPNDEAFCKTVAYVLGGRLSDCCFYDPIQDIHFTHRAYAFLNQMKSADFSDQNTANKLMSMASDLLNMRRDREGERWDLALLESI
jgi:hypothetical protein